MKHFYVHMAVAKLGRQYPVYASLLDAAPSVV
jgi:hypothetical protein